MTADARRMLRHYTPANQAELNDRDLDLGSTAPALLAGGYFVQGGKDGRLRLLSLNHLPGVNRSTGGELQSVSTPGGADLFALRSTASAVRTEGIRRAPDAMPPC